MDLQPFVQLGVGGAALAVLVLVVRTMRRLMADVLDFFGNHMSESVKQQARTAEALSTVASSLDGLKEEVRRMREP